MYAPDGFGYRLATESTFRMVSSACALGLSGMLLVVISSLILE